MTRRLLGLQTFLLLFQVLTTNADRRQPICLLQGIVCEDNIPFWCLQIGGIPQPDTPCEDGYTCIDLIGCTLTPHTTSQQTTSTEEITPSMTTSDYETTYDQTTTTSVHTTTPMEETTTTTQEKTTAPGGDTTTTDEETTTPDEETTPPEEETTPPETETTPPEEETTPPEEETTPPEEETTPPEEETTPPEEETTPPMEETTPPEGETTPPETETTPPEEETTPPEEETTPPEEETTPPEEETTPPEEETTPPEEETTPPEEETTPWNTTPLSTITDETSTEVTTDDTPTTDAFLCSTSGIVPNPATDCSFYYCYEDLTYQIFACQDGFHFDATSLLCVLGSCGLLSSSSSISTSTVSPFVCSGVGAVSNPDSDCSFYYCFSDGAFVVISCPDGYYFDTASNECVVGTCGNVTSTVTSSPEPTTPALDCSSPGVKPHPASNCWFYYCFEDGSLQMIQCQDGFYFDPVTLLCVPGYCDSSSSFETTLSTSTVGPIVCTGVGLMANPITDCSFYYCFPDGTFQLFLCQDGFHFNVAMNECVSGYCDSLSSFESTLSSSTVGPISCTEVGLIANPITDCSFYFCFPDGTYQLFLCQDGFNFNAATNECVEGSCKMFSF